RPDDAIDDGLAIFGFACLEERCVGPGLDEVAFGECAEQPRRFALYLAPNDEGRVEGRSAAGEMLTIAALYGSGSIGYSHGPVEHGARCPDVRPIRIRGFASLPEHADDSLRSGQVAGAQQNDGPLPWMFEYVHLAERGKVVDARVGARVRREDNAIVEENPHAVGHDADPQVFDLDPRASVRYSVAAAKVSQASISPDSTPRLNQDTR